MTNPFGDRLSAAIARCRTCLCVGLDPHLSLLPAELGARTDEPQSESTATAVSCFLSAVIEECAGRVPSVKPQAAFFEQLGWRGIRVMEETVRLASSLGLLVILDAKRGDVGSTAMAYSSAYLSPSSPCKVDAITLNPYLGLDSLKPFFDTARAAGAGLFVLAKTSNAGSGLFQDRISDGKPMFLHVAESLRPYAAELTGASGWSSLGVVAGATYPEHAAAIREALPSSFLLSPGIGSQPPRRASKSSSDDGALPALRSRAT
jgi:orotidine-5'-phosphate decarboxylase